MNPSHVSGGRLLVFVVSWLTIKVRVRVADQTLGSSVTFFFPRVRTPCGHGAQVIVEGREEKTDGGERNEDPKNQPKNQTPKPAGRLHHLIVFPIH